MRAPKPKGGVFFNQAVKALFEEAQEFELARIARDAETSLKSNSVDVDAHSALLIVGVARKSRQQVDWAFKRAIGMGAGTPVMRRNYLLALIQLGALRDAIACAEEMLPVMMDDVEFLKMAVEANLQMAQFSRALTLRERLERLGAAASGALERLPTNAELNSEALALDRAGVSEEIAKQMSDFFWRSVVATRPLIFRSGLVATVVEEDGCAVFCRHTLIMDMDSVETILDAYHDALFDSGLAAYSSLLVIDLMPFIEHVPQAA